jgi:hypothetical protein
MGLLATEDAARMAVPECATVIPYRHSRTSHNLSVSKDLLALLKPHIDDGQAAKGWRGDIR